MGLITEKGLDSLLRNKINSPSNSPYVLMYATKSNNDNYVELVDAPDYSYEHNFEGANNSIIYGPSSPITFVDHNDLGNKCLFKFNNTGLHEIIFRTNVWGTEQSIFSLNSFDDYVNNVRPFGALNTINNYFPQDIGRLPQFQIEGSYEGSSIINEVDQVETYRIGYQDDGNGGQGTEIRSDLFNRTQWQTFQGNLIVNIDNTSEKFVNQLLFFNTVKTKIPPQSGNYSTFFNPAFGARNNDYAMYQNNQIMSIFEYQNFDNEGDRITDINVKLDDDSLVSAKNDLFFMVFIRKI